MVLSSDLHAFINLYKLKFKGGNLALMANDYHLTSELTNRIAKNVIVTPQFILIPNGNKSKMSHYFRT